MKSFLEEYGLVVVAAIIIGLFIIEVFLFFFTHPSSEEKQENAVC